MQAMVQPLYLEQQERLGTPVFDREVANCQILRWSGILGAGRLIDQFRAQCQDRDCKLWSPSGLAIWEVLEWTRGHGAEHAAPVMAPLAVPA